MFELQYCEHIETEERETEKYGNVVWCVACDEPIVGVREI